jgi:hypothetical protein
MFDTLSDAMRAEQHHREKDAFLRSLPDSHRYYDLLIKAEKLAREISEKP